MSAPHRPSQPWRPAAMVLPAGERSSWPSGSSWLRRALRHRWWVSIPEPLGLRTTDDLLVVLVLDESGSTGTTDPLGLRHLDSRLALRFLRRHSHGRDDHVAVIHFADQPVTACPPLPLRRRYHRIVTSLSRPTITGGTAFVPALRMATRLVLDHAERAARAQRPFHAQMEQGDRSVRALVVWFTDGLSSEPLAAVAEAVAPVGADRVHLVALDQDGAFAAAQPAFDSLGLGSIRRLRRMDGAALELAMGRVLVEELGMDWGGDDEDQLVQKGGS
jgi:hypothetical protein